MNKLLSSIRKLTLIAAIATIAILGVQFFQISNNTYAAPNPLEEATVTIQGFQFQPDEVVLQQGGAITFINKDSTPHTATPTEASEFDGTGRLKKDESMTVVFSKVGDQNYFCEIHPSMEGKITVVE